MMSEPWSTTIPGETLSRYFDVGVNREIVKIKPGEYFATTRPYVIATVLGSCVAACIRDTTLLSAGMNHFMLAQQGPQALAEGESASLRYGSFAMESLINEFIKRGSRRENLEAKVFGGAAVVDAISTDVGASNALFVRQYLTVEGIRTTVFDVGGSLPRKILFFVEDGRVLVKYLKRRTNEAIERLETEYARKLAARNIPVVDFFDPPQP